MAIKQVFVCLGLVLGFGAQCNSLEATDIPSVAKDSLDIEQKIKKLRIERERLQLRANILRDSAYRKLTQDWLGYRMVLRELAEIEERIQEIDAEINELENQKQGAGSLQK